MDEEQASASPPTQPLAPALRTAPAPFGRATKTILVVLWVAFAIELVAARSFSPSAPLLYALGGVSRGAVLGGELHRLLTASLLHGDLVHILFNSLALFSSGRILESRVGVMCTFIVFAVGAFGGALASVLLNDPRVVSVGASGAIMGVAAAAGVVSFSMPIGPARSAAQRYLVQALVFNLLPLAGALKGGTKVDYGAHLGGALFGAAVGGVFFLSSKARSKEYYALPLSPRAGAAGALFCGVLYVLAAGRAAVAFPKEAAMARLDPADILVKDDLIPRTNPEATVESWGKDKPRDPRVHVFRGLAAMQRADDDLAETELRKALSEPAILEAFFPDGHTEGWARKLLAEVLLSKGNVAEADAIAKRACALKQGPEILAPLGYCEKANVAVPTQALILADRCGEAIAQKALSAAQLLCDRALPVASLPLESAQLYVARGRIAEIEKRDADADLAYEKALAHRKRVTPQDMLELARTEHRLAMVEDRIGKTPEAEANYRAALADYRAAGVAESMYVANTLANLARMVERRGQLPEAQEHASAALEMQLKLEGKGPVAAETAEILAHILRAQGRTAEAADALRRAR